MRGQKYSRAKPKRAVYVLFYKSILLAVIEAKDNNHLSVPRCNRQRDMPRRWTLRLCIVLMATLSLNLIERKPRAMLSKKSVRIAFHRQKSFGGDIVSTKALPPNKSPLLKEENYRDETEMSPRYYQQIAINRTVEAIVQGQDRVLLVMATGTGKTYMAFQIL